jgi:hypothetical protein
VIKDGGGEDREDEDGSGCSSAGFTGGTGGNTGSSLPSISLWQKLVEPAVFYSLIQYAIVAFIYTTFEEMFPVFAKADGLDGLSFDTNTVGMALMVGGMTLMLFQLCMFPSIVAHLGVIPTFRTACLASVPLFLVFPLLSLSAGTPAVLWPLLFLTLGFKMACAASSFTTIMMMIARGAEGEHLGSVNGISQSLGSCARAVGPTLGGTIWSWSLTLPFTFHQEAVFVLIAAMATLAWALSFRLPTFLGE